MRTLKFRIWFAGAMWEHGKLDFNEVLLNPEYKVMQWTGLHDRHGVEIYEGDICKYQDVKWSKTNPENYEPAIGEIFWWESAAGFGVGDIGLFRVPNNLEVIGNIHQNPELLNA